MKAVLRLGMAIATAGLWLGQAPALAQSTSAATANAPAPDAIGPRELQNFSLQGNVTRPAEQAPASQAPTAQAPRAAPSTPSDATQTRPARTARGVQARTEAPAPASTASVQPAPVPLSESATPTATPAAAGLPSAPAEGPASLAPERGLLVWSWLVAALAVGIGGAFLVWRRNSRLAYARGQEPDAFVAPEPEPLPQPRVPTPAPAQPAPPQPTGFISSRMRPWLEVNFQPLRCIVEEQGVTVEFELELFNSGNAPARDVLVGVNLFNAGPAQEQELQAFFEESGQAEPIAAIGPLQRLSLRPQLSVRLDQLRVLEAAGRRVFVPLIAFNARYSWVGGAGQTASAYLLGRETKAEKLAPFRLDLGPRVFRGLGARALPLSVRS